jgi:Putative prokaryotic signal transducing protein
MDQAKRKAPEGRGETVVVHRADSWTEAVVIRGLLESAGIHSPSLTRTDPYPFSNPPAEFPGAEILVREADVEEARRIIAEYLSASESANENEATEPGGESGAPSEN